MFRLQIRSQRMMCAQSIFFKNVFEMDSILQKVANLLISHLSVKLIANIAEAQKKVFHLIFNKTAFDKFSLISFELNGAASFGRMTPAQAHQ